MFPPVAASGSLQQQRSPELLDGQHVRPAGVGVGDAVHGLFDHEDAQATDLLLLGTCVVSGSACWVGA